MLTIRQAVHEPTRRMGTPLFTGESNLPRQPGIWEPERLNRHRLEGFLCDEARYIIGRGGRKVGPYGLWGVSKPLRLWAALPDPADAGGTEGVPLRRRLRGMPSALQSVQSYAGQSVKNFIGKKKTERLAHRWKRKK